MEFAVTSRKKFAFHGNEFWGSFRNEVYWKMEFLETPGHGVPGIIVLNKEFENSGPPTPLLGTSMPSQSVSQARSQGGFVPEVSFWGPSAPLFDSDAEPKRLFVVPKNLRHHLRVTPFRNR